MAASKPNAAYWQKRFKAIENQANLTGADSLSYITAQYQQAAKEIEAQISTWYVRFAKNNGISMHEAKQALAGSDLAEFKWTVQDYIKYGEENALNGLWMQQLENASAKWHVTKLEALQLQNQATIEALFGKQYQSLSGALGSVYQGSYYHSCYEVQKAFEMGWNVAALDDNKLSAILSTPWTKDGSTFSDRLWTNKQKLIQETQNTLTQGIMTGKAPDKMIKEIQAKMNTSRANAGRLVMTESAAMSAMGQKDAFGELGVEEFQIVETLDHVTCDVCAQMDGQHFPMSDYEIGVTVPPFHPWCRGCTCPYFNDEFTADSERIARAADGTQYYVPGDTSYQEWKAAFVDGDKSGFDVTTNSKSGLTSYKKPAPPEPQPTPKKEYMTKKKLEGLIADADTQITDLQEQFKFASGGFTHEEVITQHGTLDNFAQGKKLSVLQDLQDQLNQITAQKDQWQEALNEKLIAAEMKKLKKESLLLQDQVDTFKIKTYSGIWKDDVTTAEWLLKHGSIQAKKDYFTNKLLYAVDLDEMNKWKDLIQQLEEFDVEGKAYYDLQSQLKKIQGDLQLLQNGGKINDTFSQDRKDAAYWFTNKNGSVAGADAVLRTTSGDVWKAATTAEKDAIYEYTRSYHKFNEPLRGIEYGTNKFLGIGNVDLEQIGVTYGGFKPGEVRRQIDAMTSIIEKSSYSVDFWVQRGCRLSGMDKFLGINASDFQLSASDLAAKLIGTKPTEYAFLSTGVAKGKGLNTSGGIVFNIYAPAGTKMMYVEPFSVFGNGSGRSWDGIAGQSSFGDEAEMILQRGTTFRITKVDKSNGTIYIDMDVIKQEVY